MIIEFTGTPKELLEKWCEFLDMTSFKGKQKKQLIDDLEKTMKVKTFTKIIVETSFK